MTIDRSKGRFVYQWFDFGFFSELNNMLLAILYCRMLDKEFVLSSRYAIVFHDRGWRDFFEPFCAETDSRILHFLDSRPLGSSGGLRSRLHAIDRYVRRSLLTHVVRPLFYPGVDVLCQHWDALRAQVPAPSDAGPAAVVPAPQPRDGQPDPCPLREALRTINREVWHFNDATAGSVETTIGRLALTPLYGALHIRRGDMCDAVQPIDELRYIERLEQVACLQDVYVATDDYRCVEVIRRLRPAWRVSSLCPKTMRGYFPEDFDRLPADERRCRTLLLLTETEIMRRAHVFVGTYSSGIGTYQGIARDRHTYGVDCAQWTFEGGV